MRFPEEVDCQQIFSEPLPGVIQALQTYTNWQDLLNNLPDREPSLLKSLAS